MTKTGRPKLPDQDKKKVFPIRLSDTERAALMAKAKAEKLPLATWLRKILTEAAK